MPPQLPVFPLCLGKRSLSSGDGAVPFFPEGDVSGQLALPTTLTVHGALLRPRHWATGLLTLRTGQPKFISQVHTANKYITEPGEMPKPRAVPCS